MRKIAQKVAFTWILIGTLASLGNYLWLIGILPKPEESLMESRWMYTAMSYMLGVIALVISTDSTIDL